MNESKYLKDIQDSIELIKGKIQFDVEKRLVTDYGFESIDVIDLFFEIQQKTGIDVDINEIATIIGGNEGRRFNDISIKDILKYLISKS
jgi:acyl carrier protein